LLLPHAEFAYNKAPSKTIGVSPFKVVYGFDPLGPLYLVPRPLGQKPSANAEDRIKEIQKLHEQVKQKIENSSLTYQAQANKHRKKVVFQPGNLVWIHLTKDSFPTKRKGKLMPRSEGPFEVFERVNDNAYMIDLPSDYNVSATFNVSYLSPYLHDTNQVDWRTNLLQKGEDDGGLSSKFLIDSCFKQLQVEVQKKVQRTQGDTPGLDTVYKPGFVHCIS